MFFLDLGAVEGDQGDFVAIEDPDQAEGEHHEDVPLAERETVELAEDPEVELLGFLLFFVEVHGGGGSRGVEGAIRKSHCISEFLKN